MNNNQDYFVLTYSLGNPTISNTISINKLIVKLNQEQFCDTFAKNMKNYYNETRRNRNACLHKD